MASKYKLSPSSSQRFLTCTASLPFNLDFTENENTLKGNLQHRVAFLRLDQLLNDKDHNKEIEKLTDTKEYYRSQNNKDLKVKWDKNCQETVDNYITYVKQLIEQFKPKMIFLEYRIKMIFHTNPINGVIDLAMILENDDIVIVDLKTGRVKVDTEDNSQMLMYGYGMIQSYYQKTQKLPKNIIISIAQSLVNNTQAMKYSLYQMMEWYYNQTPPMREINSNNLVFRPNKKACQYCQHRDSCNARIKAGIV